MSGYILNVIISIIVIIGALNWGIVGISSINVIERVFGSSLARTIYILIGFAGFIQLIILITQEQSLKYLV
jgi:uncharacterized membrane protein YuzA (DUF378 family)